MDHPSVIVTVCPSLTARRRVPSSAVIVTLLIQTPALPQQG